MEHGRTALVTGASRGIGQGIALELAGAGYDLAISYRNYEEGALAVKHRAEALGRRCEIYQADFVDTAAPEKLLRAVEADFGAIDAAVMNGAYDNRRSILTATADWMETMAHQLYISQMLIAGAAARLMVRTKTRGALLFITSIHGRQANTNDFFYGGMKAAIERSCQSLAIELAPYGVRANCIAPGAINVRGADDTKLKYPYANLIPAGAARRAGGHRSRGGVPPVGSGELHHGPVAVHRRRHGAARAARGLGRAASCGFRLCEGRL